MHLHATDAAAVLHAQRLPSTFPCDQRCGPEAGEGTHGRRLRSSDTRDRRCECNRGNDMGGSGDGGHVYAVTLTAKSPLFCNKRRERSVGEWEREGERERASTRGTQSASVESAGGMGYKRAASCKAQPHTSEEPKGPPDKDNIWRAIRWGPPPNFLHLTRVSITNLSLVLLTFRENNPNTACM